MAKKKEEINIRIKETKGISRKTLSFLMAVLLLFSVSVPVFAGQNQSEAPPGSQFVDDFENEMQIDLFPDGSGLELIFEDAIAIDGNDITFNQYSDYIQVGDMIEVEFGTHHIIFISHGHTAGTVPVTRELVIPGSMVVDAPGNLAKEGHIFGGWQLYGTYVVYQPGEVVYFHSMDPAHFVAIWIPYFSDDGWQFANDEFIPFSLPGPTITNPAIDNQWMTHAAFTFRWNSIAGTARYLVSLRNVTTGVAVFERVNNGTLLTRNIPQNNLTAGHTFRIAVGAVDTNGTERWSVRYFRVQRPLNTPTINTPVHNQVLPLGNVTVGWTGTAGATYVLSLRRLDNEALLLNHFPMGTTTALIISQVHFVPGVRYRVAVGATLDGRTLWSERYFSIQGPPPTTPPVVELTVEPTQWRTAAVGGELQFRITTNQPIGNVSVVSSAPSWLRVSGTGNVRTLTALENPGPTARPQATVTVSVAGLSRTITVTQDAPAALSLSRGTWEPTGRATSVSVIVTSNITWEMPTSNRYWLTVDNVTPANRTGNGSFRINVTANTTNTYRVGQITIRGGGATHVITVRQAAQNVSIFASPSVIDFEELPLGYDRQGSSTVVVANNGESIVRLNNLPTVANWVLTPGANWGADLGPGQVRTFFVRPACGLTVGTYNRSFDVTGMCGVSTPVQLRFTVTAIPSVTVNYDLRSNAFAIFHTSLNNVYAVKPAFSNIFAINLASGVNGITPDLNQGAGCDRDIHLGCCIECYPNLSRCYDEHHRSANRLVRVNLGTANRNVFKFVDFGLCSWQGGTTGHRGDGLAGVADAIGGNTILVSHANSLYEGNRLGVGDAAFRGAIVHEISHLFGARDDVCTPDQNCVMSHWWRVNDEWCDRCRRDIFNYRLDNLA